jgi:cytochrome c oxidase assembly protein subunit 15
LGQNAQGEPLTFEALTAIHYVHRLAAYAVLAYLAWLALCLRRVAETPAKLLLGLLLLQLLTGLSNVVLDWPLVAAVLHTGGAAAMVVVLVWLLTGARASRTALN